MHPARDIPDALAGKMERLLVPLRDVKRVLWEAEREQSGFRSADGEVLVSARLEPLTIWVRALPEGSGAYALRDVYTHRMRIGEGEK